MRSFRCHHCWAPVEFSTNVCPRCRRELGYFPHIGDLEPLEPVGNGYRSFRSDVLSWRCLNFAWGCNWMLPARTGDIWCVSCRLTRGRPTTEDPSAVQAWSVAEEAKRRLVHQLNALRLPIGPVGPGRTGVVFDLLYLPDGAGATGHHEGVVTLDLREVDDGYREDLRQRLGEADRTVLGHLRHEIGHHYWRLLIEDRDATTAFRALFGDERTDYAAALEAHYGRLRPPDAPVPPTHISDYATVHPTEDWAETFAHYLHLRDGLETGRTHHDGAAVADETFESMVSRWRALTAVANRLAVGLGHRPAYPFHVTPVVAEKLAFVHRQVADTVGVAHQHP